MNVSYIRDTQLLSQGIWLQVSTDHSTASSFFQGFHHPNILLQNKPARPKHFKMQFTLIPVLFAAAAYAGCNTNANRQDVSGGVCSSARPWYVFVSIHEALEGNCTLWGKTNSNSATSR